MQRQKRNILLLIDNAACHSLYEDTNLSNITVHYLPPNTTAHLQPCDAGIVYSFKVNFTIFEITNQFLSINSNSLCQTHYRKLFCQSRIAAYDEAASTNPISPPAPKSFTIKDAVDWVAQAWHNVSTSTIQNCWDKTGILVQKSEN